MDFVIETILSAVGRFIGHLFVELFLHGFCYITGYGLVKAATLGKKPKVFFPKPRSRQEEKLAFLGFFFWATVLSSGAILLWG